MRHLIFNAILNIRIQHIIVLSDEESNPPEKKYVKMGTVIRETVKVEKKEKNNSESED